MARFTEISEEEYDANLDVNLKGVFLCGQAAARVMIPRGRGAIVNTASMAGKRGAAPYLAHYVASKFGVVGLTQAMAAELAPHGSASTASAPATSRPRCRSASSTGRPRSAARPSRPCARCGSPTRRSAATRDPGGRRPRRGVPGRRRPGVHHRRGRRRQRRRAHGLILDARRVGATQVPPRSSPADS